MNFKKVSLAFCYAAIVICVILLTYIICIVVSEPINKVTNHRDVTVTVTDKVVKYENGAGKYLIYTEDKNGEINVYQVSNSLCAGRFDSAEDFAKIEVGKTYKFNIAGSRNKFLMWYPNIYEIEEISE